MKTKTNLQLAIADLINGVLSIHIWPALGWQEVLQRYRRSLLGPFWLTISTGIMVVAMGPLYGKLLGQDMAAYFPYLAVSMVLWSAMVQVVNESSLAYIGAEGFIKQVRLPYSIYVLRLIWKNLIVLMHNLVVVVIVLIVFQPPVGAGLVLFPIAVLVFFLNALWVGILLGMLCARFRDMPLIVTNLMQVAFFLTPIMWTPDMLGRHAWTVNFNPLFHVLEIMRAPLLGKDPSGTSWMFVIAMSLLGYAITLACYSRFRARIAYWV